MGERASYDSADHVTHYDGETFTDPALVAIWRQETSRKFHDLMDGAMMVSFYKYGAVALGYPERVNAIESLKTRLHYYLHGKKNPLFGDEGQPEFTVPPGNVEYLVDLANFAMIEFMHPNHSSAYYQATDAKGSAGREMQNGEVYNEANQYKNADIEPPAPAAT